MNTGVLSVAACCGAVLALGGAWRRDGSALPPDLEPGRSIMVDWKGTGAARGEVVQVSGSWVKLKIGQTVETGKESAVTAVVVAWVNTDRMSYFVPISPK